MSHSHAPHLAAMSSWCPHLLRRGSALTVRNLTGFAGVREEVLVAVPGAIATVEELRRDTFKTPNSRPTGPIHHAYCPAGPFVSLRRLN